MWIFNTFVPNDVENTHVCTNVDGFFVALCIFRRRVGTSAYQVRGEDFQAWSRLACQYDNPDETSMEYQTRSVLLCECSQEIGRALYAATVVV